MSCFLGTHNEGTMTAAACMAGVMVPFKRISRRNGQAGDVPAHVANGRALLINDYAASPLQARPPSLVAGVKRAA